MQPLDPASRGESYSPVPGPADRESFFEAQRRHRRATWRLSAVCFAAVAIMGIPLSLVLTPVLYTLVLVLAHLADLVAPIPESFWQMLAAGASLMIRVIGGFLGEEAPASVPQMLVGLSVMLLPGAVAMVLIWLGLHSLFLRAGVGGALLALGAREPRDGDQEERQLVNVVEEMAVASGLRPPRVMLLDSEAANAAAIGASSEDATVVVSRRVLDELDRNETQGVIGHLVGSTGNGDLRIALNIASVFQAYGLLITLVDTPFGAESRAAVMRLLRFAMWRGSDVGREAGAVSALLTRHLGMEGEDDLDRFMEADQAREDSVMKSIRTVVLLPVLFTNLAIKMTLWITVSFMLGPLIALLWRARRYLADATAVQLTRYPDGLARALNSLGDKGATIPDSSWATHLFVIGSQGGGRDAAAAGSFLTYHPPLKRRLNRLRSLGATSIPDEVRPGGIRVVGNILAVVVVGPLVVVAFGLLLCLAGIIIGLDLLFMGVAMNVIHGLFSLL